MSLPLRRDEAGVPPPCHECPKVPKGVEPIPANAVEFDDLFNDVYSFFREWREFRDPVRDPFVRSVLVDVVDATAKPDLNDSIPILMMRLAAGGFRA